MRLKRFFSLSESWRKGQSLIELTLVLTLLLTLLVGMVEFGYLLNQYITVVDAAREGARFASSDDPFIRTLTKDGAGNIICNPPPDCMNMVFFTNVDQIVEGVFNSDGVTRANRGALAPIQLRPEAGDDVVVTFFSIYNGQISRYPLGYAHGWSYYHYLDPVTYAGRESAFSDSDIQARLDALPVAPDIGMVVVEVYYSYVQLLKLGTWIFANAENPNGDIPLHTYSIMPLSAAEPTLTPVP
jgi:hypothetical protein